jgi:hypothetical protein
MAILSATHWIAPPRMAAAVTGACLLVTTGCGRAYPLEQEQRDVAHSSLAGMFVEPVGWPDTLIVGQRSTAEVELLLADSTPFPPDYVFWDVDSTSIAELYPTRVPESKRVRAVGPGRAVIRVRVYVYKPHGGENFYRADLIREVVVRPP